MLAGIEVGVVNPKRIRALRFAQGKRARTDRLDAGLVARFALMMDDAARPVPNAKAFEIRALSTRRRQLVEMAAARADKGFKAQYQAMRKAEKPAKIAVARKLVVHGNAPIAGSPIA
jgi:transposase